MARYADRPHPWLRRAGSSVCRRWQVSCLFPSQVRGLGSGPRPSPRGRGRGPSVRSSRPTRISRQRWHNRRQPLPPRRVHPPDRQLSMDQSYIHLATSTDLTAAAPSTARDQPQDFNVDGCGSVLTAHLPAFRQPGLPHTCTLSHHLTTLNPAIGLPIDRTNPAHCADVHTIHNTYCCHSDSAFSSPLHADR